jgi:hypothetical protein
MNDLRYKEYEEFTGSEILHIVAAVIMAEEAKTEEELRAAKAFAASMPIQLKVLEA